MGAFILFVSLSTFSASGGLATTSAEFNSKDSCLAAAKEVSNALSTFATSTKVVCIKK